MLSHLTSDPCSALSHLPLFFSWTWGGSVFLYPTVLDSILCIVDIFVLVKLGLSSPATTQLNTLSVPVEVSSVLGKGWVAWLLSSTHTAFVTCGSP